jgi:hypothetical protein
MATDLGRAKSSAAGRYDTFVAAQLARAERRVRALDLAAGLLGFAAGTLAFAVLMVLLDRQFVLSLSARKTALFLYALGAAAYLWLAVLRPLRRRVNPYYAARQVERTLASAKNSLVNWVDLHDEPLPATIRGAVGQRAAKDLAHADLEKAISGRRAGWAGGLAAVCFAAFLVAFFLLGGRQFFSFLGRAFAPFAVGGAVPTRTLITVVRPEGGDTTVTIGRSVTVVAEVKGKPPDPKGPEAIRLLYRYQEGAPYQERLLTAESGAEWATTVAPIDVQNGFWYKVAGGDCETPDYRVSVRSAPLITGFEAAYHHRPYVARVDEVRTERKLEALRGTEVTVLVRTNRALREGRLDFDAASGLKSLAGERLAEDGRAFRVRFVLDEPGRYRVVFTSQDGETYADPKQYPVVVVTDQPPKVELTKPGQDVRLPANGVLQLEGQATDDLGVKSLTLRAQLAGGPKLKARPYRSDDKLRLSGGGYPQALAYKDFVELGKVQAEDGSALALKPGNELEYWLEAADACDYPRPNVAESKRYKVLIAEPEKDPNKQRQEQQKARQEQQQHETKQDQDLKKENRARQEARQKEQERQKEEARQREQERQNQNGEGGEKKPGEGQGQKSEGSKGGQQGEKGEGAKSEQGDGNKGQDQQPGGAKDGGGQDNKPGEGSKGGEQQPGEGQQGADEQTKRQADELQKALEKRDQQGGQGGGQSADKGETKGENKPDGAQAGEGKGGGQEQGKQGEGQGASGAEQARGSESKGEGQKDGAKGAAENKGGAGDKQGAASPKEGGGGDPMNRGGEAKDAKPMGQPGAEAGQARDKGPAEKQPERSAGKEGGAGEGTKDAAQQKPDGGGAAQQSAKKGEHKDAGSQGAGRPGDAQPQAANKEKSAPEPRAGAKGAGKEERTGQQQAKAEPKDGKQNSTNGAAQAEGKAAPEKRDGSDVARGDGKSDPKQQARDARPEDAQRLAQQMKERLEKNQGGQGSQDGQQGQKSLEEMARDLERMAKEARDPQAREAASKALEELRKETAEASAKQGPGEQGKQGQPMGEPGGEAKPAKGAAGQNAAEEKSPGSPMQGEKRGDNKGPGKGGSQGEGATGQPMPPEGQNQNGPGQAKGNGKGTPGNQPGVGLPGERQPGDPAPPSTDQGPSAERSTPRASRASVEQLERFKNKVDKDVLKDLKMSEEDYRRFLQAYEEMVQRQAAEKAGPEEGALPGGPSTLPSTGSRRARPEGAKPGTDTGAGGRALPPPPYRDAYRKFTEKIASPDK